MSMTALLVHSETASYQELRARLEAGGVDVAEADSGIKALALAELNRPGLVIVEDALPDMSGLDLCRRIAQMYNAETLLIGDDDGARRELGPTRCVTAPLRPDQIARRVARLLSPRSASAGPATIQQGRMFVLGDISLDIRTNTVKVGGRLLDLPPTQVNLLRVLMERSPRVISPAALAHHLWPRSDRDASMLADVIMKLRLALEDEPTAPRRVIHVPDYGYRLDAVRSDPSAQGVSLN